MATLIRTTAARFAACAALTVCAAAEPPDAVEIDWAGLASSFIEDHCPDGKPAGLDAALAESFGTLDLGAVRVHCPAERLTDRKWLSELAPAYVGLCELQAAYARWLRPGSEVATRAQADFAIVGEWIDSWKSTRFKKLARSETKDLAAFLEAPEDVRAALERQRAAFAKGGDLGLAMRGAERVELILTPTRRDFIEMLAFLGRDDTKFRQQNWVPGVDEWTQAWAGWRLVLACEYAPWTGFDPKFVQKKPIRDLETDGIAQLVAQQAALALLTIEGGSPEPLFTKRGIANALVISTRGALNVVDSERGMSTTGAKTEPYERFVPGGNPEGGTLPKVPAAPFDMLIESQWRKGHGEDFYAPELAKGQKAGAKAAKKEKHERAKDKLAHFVLESESQQKHTVTAPFLGPLANEQPYPPLEFLNDYREFFTAYQTAFTHWLRTGSDEDPEVCAERFARFLDAAQRVRTDEALFAVIEDVWGLPLSAADDTTPSLEWQFLAWLADQ